MLQRPAHAPRRQRAHRGHRRRACRTSSGPPSRRGRRPSATARSTASATRRPRVLAPTGCLVGGSLIATERGLVRLRVAWDNPTGNRWQDLGSRMCSPTTVLRQRRQVLRQRARAGGRRSRPRRGRSASAALARAPASRSWTDSGDVASGGASRDLRSRRSCTAGPRAADRRTDRRSGCRSSPRSWVGSASITCSCRAPSGQMLARARRLFHGRRLVAFARGLRLCVTALKTSMSSSTSSASAKELFGIEAATTDCGGYISVELHSVRLADWWRASGFARLPPPAAERSARAIVPHVPDAVLHYQRRRTSTAAFPCEVSFEADGTVTVGYPHSDDRPSCRSRRTSRPCCSLSAFRRRAARCAASWVRRIHAVRLLNQAYAGALDGGDRLHLRTQVEACRRQRRSTSRAVRPYPADSCVARSGDSSEWPGT